MSNKRKRDKFKKARNQALQTQLDIAPELLMQDGLQALEEGNARKAIELFKLTGKKTGMTNDIRTALFRAYALRTEQLEEKGMHQEAAIVKKMMAENRPVAASLSPEMLSGYIRYLSNPEAIRIYKEYAAAKGTLPEVESILGGRVAIHHAWDAILILSPDAPLRQNIDMLREAVALMDQGEWESALSTLKPLPRSSPYAPMKLVAKAMTSFYADDDLSLKKALALLPKGFPLEETLNALFPENSGSDEGVRRNSTAQSALWEGPHQIDLRIESLKKAVTAMNSAEIARSAKGLAEILSPGDPLSALIHIAEQRISHIVRRRHLNREINALIYKMLPEPHAAILLMKSGFIYPINLFSAAENYFILLKKEFPDESDLKIAKSLLIYDVLKQTLRWGSPEKDFREFRYMHNRSSVLDIKTDNFPDAMVDMAAHGIHLDPENKEWYDFLIRLPRKTRYAKNRVEEMLHVMAKTFKNDPYPYLNLADIYHEKRAFRKAEQALASAIEIAPHDQRVVDRHVAALLIAADKNIQKGIAHRVIQDLEKAENFGSKKLFPYIIEKKALAAIVDAGSDTVFATLQKMLVGVTGISRIRALIALENDLIMHRLSHAIYSKSLNDLFPPKKELYRCASSEMLSLLLPLEETICRLYPFKKPLLVMIGHYQLEAIGVLTNADLIRLMESDFSKEFHPHFLKEMERRTKKAPPYEKVVFDFCAAVIRCSMGKQRGSSPFKKIIDPATPEMIQVLRNLAGKISLFITDHTLKEALGTFQFDFLDGGMPFRFPETKGGDDTEPPPLFDDDLFDFDMDIDQEMLNNMPEDLLNICAQTAPKKMVREFTSGVELFIDEQGLRNMPENVIRAIAVRIKQETKKSSMMPLMIKIIMMNKAFRKMSREAQHFLKEMADTH